MSIEHNTPLGDGFALNDEVVARKVDEIFASADRSKDRVLAEFEHNRSNSSATQRMIEGAKYVTMLTHLDPRNTEAEAHSTYIGAVLGVYVAEICADMHAISHDSMYKRWQIAGGWTDQKQHYAATSVARHGKEAFDRLPRPITGIAVRFAVGSTLITSFDDGMIGYGLTLGPLYGHLSSLYGDSDRLFAEIDADAAELFGT